MTGLRHRDAVLRDFVLREPLFSSKDVGLQLGLPATAVAKALDSLAKSGVVTKVMRGLWANTAHPLFTPYLVVGRIQEETMRPTYVSFVSALHLLGMLSQIPREVHVATDRQRPPIQSPVGRFVFHRLPEQLMTGDEAGDEWGRFQRATPEKALFDTVYLSMRRGRQWRHLPELDIPADWNWNAWTPWIGLIQSAPLRVAMENARSRLAAELFAPPS
jgi:predicted transcriptional regulator of viral defense system